MLHAQPAYWRMLVLYKGRRRSVASPECDMHGPPPRFAPFVRFPIRLIRRRYNRQRQRKLREVNDRPLASLLTKLNGHFMPAVGDRAGADALAEIGVGVAVVAAAAISTAPISSAVLHVDAT